MAKRLGVSDRSIRTIAIVTAFVVGIGLVIYMTLWITIRRQGEEESILTRTRSNRRDKEILFVVAVAALILLIASRNLGLNTFGLLVWFLALSALEGLMAWRGSSQDERAHLQCLADATPVAASNNGESWRNIAIRIGIGLIGVVYGISLLSRVGSQQRAALEVLFGASALVFGLFVLFAPWWIRTFRDLSSERRARVRAQDRADMAAHVHDSVLQTLSLIQRAADNPSEVVRLARIQERDLRYWLVNPEAFGLAANPPASLAESVLEIEREIEDNYGVGVDTVVVGDCPLSDPVMALLAAGREATLNAAKWSGAQRISLYVEAEPERLSMFIRDLGQEFNPSTVPEDRQGISRSINERMARHEGTAKIRSTPGMGTEVELVLPLLSHAS